MTLILLYLHIVCLCAKSFSQRSHWYRLPDPVLFALLDFVFGTGTILGACDGTRAVASDVADGFDGVVRGNGVQ